MEDTAAPSKCSHEEPVRVSVSPCVPPQTVKQMWPYICQFVEKALRETVEPAIKESNSHLSTFCFSKIDIGEKVSAALLPLRGGVSLQPTALRKQTNKQTNCSAGGRWDSWWGGVGREGGSVQRNTRAPPRTYALVA